MNMSDDVAGATLQVSMKAAEKGVELGSRIADKALDDIARLLKALGKLIISKTDLSDLGAGNTSIKNLVKNARKNGDTISTSDNAFSESDMKILKKKAKQLGIPIAFTGDKENNYANVRTSDLPIFQRMCTDMMKEKLAERPQELGNFKVKDWEIPFITSELNKYDLSAQFGKTKNGEHFCLYEKADEKAIMIARNEFVKKCNELKENMTVTKDENFYVIKDKHSGKEVSFDTVPSREELSEQIQKTFGYDQNKADIACAKFGEQNLQGEEKQKFFSKNPQNNFSKIDTNITLKNESIFTKDITCWRVTPKSDSVPKIVFQNENGRFAVLNPEKMTRAKMTDILKKNLLIDDKKTIEALIDKAEKVSDYYSKQDEKNFKFEYKFSKSDFDMKNAETVSGMVRTDENGNTFTKKLPLDSVSNDIQRTGKNEFTVQSTVNILETDKDENEYISSDKQQLVLSFSDKKSALNQLVEMYKKQGVPEDVAKQMSKEVFAKAESQSPEKVLQIEEIRTESQAGKTETKVVVKSGNQSEEIEFSDPEKVENEISEKFEVPKETAKIIVEKAQENIENNVEEKEMQSVNSEEINDVQYDEKDIPPTSDWIPNDDDVPPEMSNSGGYFADDIPDDDFQYNENNVPPMSDWTPNDNDVPPEMPERNFGGSFAYEIPDAPDVPQAPEINIPTGRGGR